MVAKRNGNGGVKRAHGGSESVCCEQLEVSEPRPAGVSSVSTQHAGVYLAPGNKLLGNPISLPAAGPPAPPSRQGRPDLHGVPAPPCLSLPSLEVPPVSEVTRDAAYRSATPAFSTAGSGRHLSCYRGMMGSLSLMAQGQMQSAAGSCKCVCVCVCWGGGSSV